ncbi:MAG: translation initiation factor IF-2 N-terminal domain-containing protein, partial [Firmicutes bacterium]|nr:translation initiation factor IF-2 N-terminal domain-containing protein [Candidatus Scybalomonas excrementavium]
MSIRVRDLAKELSKTNKEILDVLATKGIEGKTQASNLEDAQI